MNPTFWISRIVRNPNASVVQIGSNDGVQGDPVHPLLKDNPSWRALLVEPVPYLFDRLRSNYGDDPRFRFVNAAVNNGDRATFYWVDPLAKEEIGDLPFWFDQLGSFNRDHILTHHNGILEPWIREMEIQGIRLPDLLARERVDTIDVFHVDTEGHDWKILSQLDLARFSPRVIIYEHRHLTESEMASSIQFLSPTYFLFRHGPDVTAVHKSAREVVNSIVRIVPEKEDK